MVSVSSGLRRTGYLGEAPPYRRSLARPACTYAEWVADHAGAFRNGQEGQEGQGPTDEAHDLRGDRRYRPAAPRATRDDQAVDRHRQLTHSGATGVPPRSPATLLAAAAIGLIRVDGHRSLHR